MQYERTAYFFNISRNKSKISGKFQFTYLASTNKIKSRLRLLNYIKDNDRTIEQFVALLKAHAITQVIDVRTIPRSRRNPQFNKDILAAGLRKKKIGYRHMKQLGGLRQAKADSQNLGWNNLSFRGFADYMQTDKFADAIEKLKCIASKKPTAIMCAEALPWRCHRSLIAFTN